MSVPPRFIPARAGNTVRPALAFLRNPVHPRSRGEHTGHRSVDAAVAGSSPLARGTLLQALCSRSSSRFIPARAGNTSSGTWLRRGPPVHPRSRGEHSQDDYQTQWSNGSSPLARGTPLRPRPVLPCSRFIPARAGNTPALWGSFWRSAVHPRSRGEHPWRPWTSGLYAGSSPLARGTPTASFHRCGRLRFIPARAGNTRTMRNGPTRKSVHPRSRGEHPRRCYPVRVQLGSSPLARGTRPWRSPGPQAGRFIPARAGNTSRVSVHANPASVHPRSRGEHQPCQDIPEPSIGSSPLARGTRGAGGCRRGGHRFIPARAGNTCARISGPWTATVHPRSRGEHRVAGSGGGARHGSSPLARGTRARAGQPDPGDRFIPARAGNTVSSRPGCGAGRVHPRSRGEHVARGVGSLAGRGSSPLARGTPGSRSGG